MASGVTAAMVTSPLKSSMRRGGFCEAASIECAPRGSQTVVSLAKGQGLPSTSAGPVQDTPTPCRDSTASLPFAWLALSTPAAAEESSGKSWREIEYSKYRATRGKELAAV